MRTPSLCLVNGAPNQLLKDSTTWLFHSWDKIPNICNFKKKMLWAQGFKSFGPWSAGSKPETLWWKSIVEGGCSTHGSQDAERAGSKNPEREERAGDKSTAFQVTPQWSTYSNQVLFPNSPFSALMIRLPSKKAHL